MSSNTQQQQQQQEGFQRVQRRRRGLETDKVLHLQQQIKNLQRRYNSARTDLLETDLTFIVRMELPVTSFRWELKDKQILLVSYQKDQEEFPGAKEVYRECRYGKSMRRVKLPEQVNPEPVNESYTNGIWVIEFARYNNNQITSEQQPQTPEIDFEKLTLADVPNSWADAVQ